MITDSPPVAPRRDCIRNARQIARSGRRAARFPGTRVRKQSRALRRQLRTGLHRHAAHQGEGVAERNGRSFTCFLLPSPARGVAPRTTGGFARRKVDTRHRPARHLLQRAPAPRRPPLIRLTDFPVGAVVVSVGVDLPVAVEPPAFAYRVGRPCLPATARAFASAIPVAVALAAFEVGRHLGRARAPSTARCSGEIGLQEACCRTRQRERSLKCPAMVSARVQNGRPKFEAPSPQTLAACRRCPRGCQRPRHESTKEVWKDRPARGLTGARSEGSGELRCYRSQRAPIKRPRMVQKARSDRSGGFAPVFTGRKLVGHPLKLLPAA